MSLETGWYALLGLLLLGWLVLDGYDLGIGMLLPALDAAEDARGGSERRLALNASGPFLLGNEVWLVATAGVLLAAFPLLEAGLMSAFYPLVVLLVCGLVLRGAGVQLRRHRPGRRWRRRMDGLTVTGSALAAAAWGLIVGGLLRGLAPGPFSVADLLHPVAVAVAVLGAALFGLHGATFLAARLTGPAAATASAAGIGLARVTPVLAVGCVAVGAAAPSVRSTVRNVPVAVLLCALLVAAPVVAGRLLARGRPLPALACTAVAVTLPVLVAAAGTYPRVLATRGDPAAGLTVADAAADPVTLELLGWVALPLVPLVLLAQAWNWWTFRGRLRADGPLYF